MGKARESRADIADYEAVAGEAVGRVIEFWGFKRNQGRLWALLYMRGHPLTAQEIMDALAISKGAVSILTKELEGWGVLKRRRDLGDGLLRYEAEAELLKMVAHVVRRREFNLVSDVRASLEEARDLAKADGADKAVIARIDTMLLLARVADSTVRFLLDRVPTELNEVASLFAPFKKS